MSETEAGAAAAARREEFEQELAALRIRGTQSGPEGRMLGVAVLLLAASIVMLVLGYWFVSGTAVLNEQNSYLAEFSFLGLGLAILGGALYVRYATARHLRYWLLRMLHEQRVQTDRIVAALETAREREQV